VVSSRSIRLTTLAAVFALVGLTAVAEDAAAPATPAAPAAPGTAAAPTPVQLPPWMSPDVIKAAVAINMTDAQKVPFNQAVGDYVTAHFQMVQKVSKIGAPNLDMTIKSRDKALVHTMDGEVAKILTPEQLPAYEEYKKVLRGGLKP